MHGVLNTDNVAISGETLDYGPCAFIDSYDPDTVFSSIDRHGRYRYSQQPSVTQWNLARLAESLLPLLEKDSARAIDLANAALAEFPAEYERAWLARFRAKLGLAVEHDDDAQLVRDLFAWMHAARADFTLTFRTLAEQLNAGEVPDCAPFTHDDANFTSPQKHPVCNRSTQPPHHELLFAPWKLVVCADRSTRYAAPTECAARKAGSRHLKPDQ